VAQHDPFVPAQSEPLDEALAGADAVLVATNHSAYEGLLECLPAAAVLIDPWNVTGSSQVFAYVDEIAPSRTP